MVLLYVRNKRLRTITEAELLFYLDLLISTEYIRYSFEK